MVFKTGMPIFGLLTKDSTQMVYMTQKQVL